MTETGTNTRRMADRMRVRINAMRPNKRHRTGAVTEGTPNARRYSMFRKGLLACAVNLAMLPAQSYAESNALGASIVANGSAGGALACASCHGARGEGNPAAGFPRLAGLGTGYIHSQLDHFAAGARRNVVMELVARQLTAEERKAVSAYFAALPAAPGVAVPNTDKPKPEDAGAWLAARGRWDDNLPACVQCHGPGGVGVGDAFPAIAGQASAYIAAQLEAFRDGSRPGGPMNLMGTVAKKLSDADIAAVANHFGAVSDTAASSDRRKK